METFCKANAPSVESSRIALQMRELKRLEGEIDEKTKILSARTADLKRAEMERARANAGATEWIVSIYATMKADAAAQQLAALPEQEATTILMRLPERNAAAILNEMSPDKAARIVGGIAARGANGSQDRS